MCRFSRGRRARCLDSTPWEVMCCFARHARPTNSEEIYRLHTEIIMIERSTAMSTSPSSLMCYSRDWRSPDSGATDIRAYSVPILILAAWIRTIEIHGEFEVPYYSVQPTRFRMRPSQPTPNI